MAAAGAGDPRQPPLAQAADWLLSLVGITASDSDEHLIKRIIGVGGDHVVCCNAIGQVTVNGTPIDETPYLNLSPGQSAPQPVPFDVVVPQNSLWVMGDNRDHSRDSRYNMDQPNKGFVPLGNVVGRAFSSPGRSTASAPSTGTMPSSRGCRPPAPDECHHAAADRRATPAA